MRQARNAQGQIDVGGADDNDPRHGALSEDREAYHPTAAGNALRGGSRRGIGFRRTSVADQRGTLSKGRNALASRCDAQRLFGITAAGNMLDSTLIFHKPSCRRAR